MKKINYPMLIVLSVAIAFVSSCKKDETPVTPAETCLLTEMDLTVFGTTSSSTLSYDGDNQVIDVQTNDGGDITGTRYTYTAEGKVSVMEEYEGASKVVTEQTEYTYGANGVTEEKLYVDNAGTLELDMVYRYDYDAGTMVQKNVFVVNGGQETKTDLIEYGYAANGDVSGTVTFSDDGVGNWEQSSRRTYTYNDKTPTRFLAGRIAGDPNFPSTHYITRDKVEDFNKVTQAWEVTSDLDYVYTYDSNGNPSKINVGQGLFVFDLTHKCK